MTTPNDTQARRMAEAHRHMPQGVAENYRYWGEDKTVFVDNVSGKDRKHSSKTVPT
jgi:hypothetical protein